MAFRVTLMHEKGAYRHVRVELRGILKCREIHLVRCHTDFDGNVHFTFFRSRRCISSCIGRVLCGMHVKRSVILINRLGPFTSPVLWMKGKIFTSFACAVDGAQVIRLITV